MIKILTVEDSLQLAAGFFKYNGQEKDVEIGAVIWVKFHDWMEK